MIRECVQLDETLPNEVFRNTTKIFPSRKALLISSNQNQFWLVKDAYTDYTDSKTLYSTSNGYKTRLLSCPIFFCQLLIKANSCRRKLIFNYHSPTTAKTSISDKSSFQICIAYRRKDSSSARHISSEPVALPQHAPFAPCCSILKSRCKPVGTACSVCCQHVSW